MKRASLVSIFKRRTRVPLSRKAETLERELICADCRAVFPESLGRCPVCHSTEWRGLVEVNPYTHRPMKNLLRMYGHALWIAGTAGFLAMLWQTTSTDVETNDLYILGALVLLISGVLCSAAFFALSELISRVLRIQRRLYSIPKPMKHSAK